MTALQETFNIRNFTDKLTPAKGANRYICPVCSGNNLTIEPKTGEYQCWNGCECKDIREAISPWSEVTGNQSAHRPSRQPKPPTPAPIPDEAIALAKLPNLATHPEKRQRGSWVEIEYPYSDTQWVLRVEKPNLEKLKGYEKTTIPYHINAEGEPTKGKGDTAWHPYRLDEVQAHGTGQWVLGVEGESCVEAARDLGLVSFTLQGSAWSEGDLTRAMLQCKTAGVTGVAYFPDHDETGYKKAAAMALAAAKAQLCFILLDPTLLWTQCPEKGDIADWVKWGMEQGWDKEEFVRRLEEQFSAAADSAREERYSRADELERNLASNKPALKSRYNQRKNAIKQLWGNRLRLNTLKQRVELDGEPLDLDFVRSELCELLDIDIPKEDAVEIVLSLARKNQYCPIVEYLERVELAYPDHGINFDSLVSQLLGTSDPLHATYLKRHLIGSVARALNPGCKMDTALILQGEQGVKKSTFFQALYGEEMFDDTMAESSDKDELMKLHQHWVVEWAEFETTVGRKGYSRLKQFMSTRIDTYRPPYGRTAKAFARRTVLVGSTNESEFLNDPTGDRRFWVIPVSRIDIELTQQLRDRIWAAALQAYKSGEQWWLTDIEQQLAADANEPYRTDDTWEQFILNYIQGRQFVTTAELLGKALEIEPAKQDRGSQMRAAAIIRRLGWRKDKRWHTGTWQRGWFAPERSTDPPFDEVDRKVDRCHNPDEIGVSTSTDLPDLPLTPTFPVSNEAKNESKIEIQESLPEGGSVLEVDRHSNACEIDISVADLPSLALRADEETTQPPAAANIRPGQRVRVHLKGSKRDGMTAVVTARSADIEGNVVVRFDSCYQLRPALQVLEASPNSLEVLTDG